jgi:hypothetical protein
VGGGAGRGSAAQSPRLRVAKRLLNRISEIGREERGMWGLMSVRFDHVAGAARDKQRSALFLRNLLGLPESDSWVRLSASVLARLQLLLASPRVPPESGCPSVNRSLVSLAVASHSKRAVAMPIPWRPRRTRKLRNGSVTS